MHSDIGIVRTYRRSNGLSTRPEDTHTFTSQYNGMNGYPMYPDPCPHYKEYCLVTDHIYTTSTSTVLELRRYHDHRNHSDDASRARPLLRKVSDGSAIIGIGSSMTEAISDYI